MCRTRHLRVPCWPGNTPSPAQHVDVLRSPQDLCYLDSDLRRRPRPRQIFRLLHHPTHHHQRQGPPHHGLGVARRHVGILLHHLHRDAALLLAHLRLVDALDVDQRRRHVRVRRRLRRHRARRDELDHRDRSGPGCGACHHPLGNADEEADQVPSVWSAFLCIGGIHHHHDPHPLRQQVQGPAGPPILGGTHGTLLQHRDGHRLHCLIHTLAAAFHRAHSRHDRNLKGERKRKRRQVGALHDRQQAPRPAEPRPLPQPDRRGLQPVDCSRQGRRVVGASPGWRLGQGGPASGRTEGRHPRPVLVPGRDRDDAKLQELGASTGDEWLGSMRRPRAYMASR
ncbi:hypothetical protein CGRA01v4_13946 [Colletotrichum graminicola]|nr:hypothetical protein CGRA01v4_13946 [Colletotrichum graminicola]